MCLTAFLSFLAIVAIVDIRLRKVPNALLIGALIVALACAVGLDGWNGGAEALGGFALGFALMLPGWLLRFTGGGDVKTFAVTGAFLGSPLILSAFVLSIFVGAAVAILLGAWAWLSGQAVSPLPRYQRMLIELLATGRLDYVRPQPNEVGGQRFPFVPVIAIGSLLAYFGLPGSQWL